MFAGRCEAAVGFDLLWGLWEFADGTLFIHGLAGGGRLDSR